MTIYTNETTERIISRYVLRQIPYTKLPESLCINDVRQINEFIRD